MQDLRMLVGALSHKLVSAAAVYDVLEMQIHSLVVCCWELVMICNPDNCFANCSRTKTLHTFLQPSQASPTHNLAGADLTAPQPTGHLISSAPDAAAQAAAFAALAGGPVRRRGANRQA